VCSYCGSYTEAVMVCSYCGSYIEAVMVCSYCGRLYRGGFVEFVLWQVQKWLRCVHIVKGYTEVMACLHIIAG